MFKSLLSSRLAVAVLGLLVLALSTPAAHAQAAMNVVDQTTLYVDPLIPGEIVYFTGDELASPVRFENTVRVNSITVNYVSSVPVNYVVRFYSGALVRVITIPNLPAGGGEYTYAIPAAQQFDWAPLVQTNILGVRTSGGTWSVQLTNTDGSDPGTLAGHRMAVGPGFWSNLTTGDIESGSSVGIATFNFNFDQESPTGLYARISGTLLAPPPSLASVTPGSTSVQGGSPATLAVVISSPAPAGGLVVRLASNSTSVTVPASVTIPAGATTANFVVRTTTVRRNTSATITATLGSTTRNAVVTVRR